MAQPFEIDGDWPTERKYDQRPSQDLRLDASPPVAGGSESPLVTVDSQGQIVPPLADAETRVRQLEATVQALWAALKALEARLGVGKEP